MENEVKNEVQEVHGTEHVAPVELKVETGEDEPTQEVDTTVDELAEKHDEFEEEAKDAPVVKEEIGSVEKKSNSVALKKSAYYVVFGPKEHTSEEVGSHIQSVHMARFESKAELKKVINTLDENGFKLIDILKGRPLPFNIQVKQINEINIGG